MALMAANTIRIRHRRDPFLTQHQRHGQVRHRQEAEQQRVENQAERLGDPEEVVPEGGPVGLDRGKEGRRGGGQYVAEFFPGQRGDVPRHRVVAEQPAAQ
jgi:hypothetical protein